MAKQKPSHTGNREYDRIFKENAANLFLPLIERRLGLGLVSWTPLQEKFPRTLEREVDFLYEALTADGRALILHIEFQKKGEKNMVYRMAEYHSLILKKFQKEVVHLVVYLGRGKPRMEKKLPQSQVFSGFELIQLNELNPEDLLKDSAPEVILLAVLAKYPPQQTDEIVRSTIERLMQVCNESAALSHRLQQLIILSRLRKLESFTINAIEDMPITYDITTDGLYLRGKKEGREELREELREEVLAEVQEKVTKELRQEFAHRMMLVASELLRAGKSVEEVAETTQLPVTTIHRIRQNLNN